MEIDDSTQILFLKIWLNSNIDKLDAVNRPLSGDGLIGPIDVSHRIFPVSHCFAIELYQNASANRIRVGSAIATPLADFDFTSLWFEMVID